MTLAVVTGGSRGIGRAIVERLVETGTDVVTCARDWGSDLSASEVNSSGGTHRGNVIALTADLSTREGVARLADEVLSLDRSVDLLIHNAGVQYRQDLSTGNTLDSQLLRREFEVNVFAPIELTDLLLPALRKSAHPVIVYVTSIVAIAPRPTAGVYGASKAALRTYSDALRRGLETDEISVVEFVPPLTDTDMAKSVSGPRKVTPEDAADALLRGLESGRHRISSGENGWYLRIDGAVRRMIGSRIS
jgi:uncharacterized oxidoreductase